MPEHENEHLSVPTTLRYIQRDIEEIKAKLSDSYVTKAEFIPVQRFTYGMIGVLTTSVFLALLALVLK